MCQVQRDQQSFLQSAGCKLAAASAAALLSLGGFSDMALANELDVINEPKPTKQHVIDDAGVLNKTTRKGLNDDLTRLEIETGYRVEVITLRKLEFENDPFAFGDKLVEKWYPTVEEGNDKGLLLIVSTAKDGALTGGPKFVKAIGDDLVESIVTDNIPILTEQEKFNETAVSSVKRISAKLRGQEDPGPPARADTTRARTFKTKGETEQKKGITGPLVLTLLAISVIVPMLQYYGYTSED